MSAKIDEDAFGYDIEYDRHATFVGHFWLSRRSLWSDYITVPGLASLAPL
jgi:hypothetical protein